MNLFNFDCSSQIARFHLPADSLVFKSTCLDSVDSWEDDISESSQDIKPETIAELLRPPSQAEVDEEMKEFSCEEPTEYKCWQQEDSTVCKEHSDYTTASEEKYPCIEKLRDSLVKAEKPYKQCSVEKKSIREVREVKFSGFFLNLQNIEEIVKRLLTDLANGCSPSFKCQDRLRFF